MRENRLSGLMRGGKQTVIGIASQSVASCLLYTEGREFSSMPRWREAFGSNILGRFTMRWREGTGGSASSGTKTIVGSSARRWARRANGRGIDAIFYAENRAREAGRAQLLYAVRVTGWEAEHGHPGCAALGRLA